MAVSAASLPIWVAPLGGLLFVVGVVGLVRTAGWAMRLYQPTENTFAWPAAQQQFRFRLSQAGRYEISITRPGLLNQHFLAPSQEFTLQALPNGPVQALHGSLWSQQRRTNLSGDATLRLLAFTAAAPGEFELRNPGAAQFRPGDQLRLLPDTGRHTLGLVLAFLLSGLATIGGLVGGIIGLANR